MEGFANLALEDRAQGACNVERIPTGRFPVFMTTLRATIATGETSVEFEFEPQRDVLLTNLTYNQPDASIGAVGDAVISAEYCNVKMLDKSTGRAWYACCQRKPIFLVGVREDKTLKFRVDYDNPAEADTEVKLSIAGFQGNGCCG